MKFDKKVMESGVVAAFSLVLAFSAMSASHASAKANLDSQTVELTAEPKLESSFKNEIIATIEERQLDIAAAVSALQQQEEAAQELKKEKLSKKKDKEEKQVEDIKLVAQQTAENTDENKEEKNDTEEIKTVQEKKEEQPIELEEGKKEEQAAELKEGKKEEGSHQEESAQLVETVSQEVSPWAEKLMPNVEEYLNIRTEASEEAELAGKLHKGSEATILERGEEWTRISSGSVEGYVKNDYCVTGLEAESLANQLGTTYATAVTGGVRVRETASSEEDVKILDVLEEEGKIKVDKDAETIDGWVAVKLDEQVGYVSADYVNVDVELGKAISIEEEQAAIAAAEAEAAAEQASQSAAQEGGSQQKAAVAASYDDVTLLGALIQCEAGGECYEGQVAVGAVVMNRLRAGYAGSISGVIYQGGQFTPASSGALASVLANGVSGSCLQAAQEAINGVDNVGGATSFRRAGSANGLVIGNHVFF